MNPTKVGMDLGALFAQLLPLIANAPTVLDELDDLPAAVKLVRAELRGPNAGDAIRKFAQELKEVFDSIADTADSYNAAKRL